jgi:AcrR family transcriptional regulator
MSRSVGGGRPETTTRDRIVRGAAQLIRTQGVTATGMRDVVAFAGAPRGSLQHYFPGGKDQLVCEALLWSGDASGRLVHHLFQGMVDPTPGQLLAELVGWWRNQFLRTGFDAGCPLVAATVDVAASSDAIREVINEALDHWVGPIAEALGEMGVPEARAANLAVLILSALEGAIVLARIRTDVAPLDIVVAELTPMLDHAIRPS